MFYKNLRIALLAKEITQNELASMININPCTLSKKMCCKLSFGFDEVLKISEILNESDLKKLFKK